MTLPDAIRQAVDVAVRDAPSGDALLAATRRRPAGRAWLVPAAAAAAVVAIAAGATAWRAARTEAPAVRATAAAATSDGIRVTLTLDRRSVRVGELVRASGSVTNTGRTAVRFGGGSCQAPGSEPNIAVDLRPGQPRGRAWTGIPAAVKAAALDRAPYSGSFSERGSGTGCALYLRTWTLAPGQTLRVGDVVWRARTPLNSAYDGDATVSAVFRYRAHPKQAVPREVRASLPLRVTGGDPTVLTPAAAVDRALEDPPFARFAAANPPSTWSPGGPGAGLTPQSSYKDTSSGSLVQRDVWVVSLKRNAGARYGSLTLDARTGAILVRQLAPTFAPADAQTPAAGGCATASGAIATVELNPDVPQPRCLIVRADQRLRVVNTTARFGSPGQTVTVTWAGFPQRRLAIGASTTYDQAMGEYLAPGVHRLRTSLYAGSGAEIWLQPRP